MDWTKVTDALPPDNVPVKARVYWPGFDEDSPATIYGARYSIERSAWVMKDPAGSGEDIINHDGEFIREWCSLEG